MICKGSRAMESKAAIAKSRSLLMCLMYMSCIDLDSIVDQGGCGEAVGEAVGKQFAGGYLLKRCGMEDVIHPVHRVLDGRDIPHIADVVADLLRQFRVQCLIQMHAIR